MSAVLESLPAPHVAERPVSPPATRVVCRADGLRRDLRSSVADGASFGVMVGIGETYLAAFVLAVGLGEVVAGLIASVPQLAGGIMQLVSPRAVRRLGSHQRWIVLCAALQAASFLPLVAAALLGSIPAPAALLIAAVYWGSGMATGPAWNTWMGRLVPRSIRPRYFARRTRISQAAVLTGFLIGGFLLQAGAAFDRTLLAFAVLFFVAAACRSASAWFLAQQSEPRPIPLNGPHSSPRAVLRQLYAGRSGRLLSYILAMQVAVQVSGPYFSPYMLRELKLSYADFVTLIAASFVAKILTLPLFGHLAHRFGTRRLLWIGGAGIIPVAGLWLVSNSFGWLIGVQLLSGAFWAAYELATFLLFFESIAEDERTTVLTLFNLLNAVALVIGALVGGAILHACGASPAGYAILFGLSSALRAVTLVLLRRVPGEVVETEAIPVRILGIRPGGSIDHPILPGPAEPVGEAAPAAAG